MIKNFKNHTVEINDEEKKFVPVIVSRFQTKPGRENIVTADQMIDGIFKRFGVKFTDVRVRKIIQYIRLNELVPGLVATSKGYFAAKSIDEINDWIDSLKSRENAIRQIRETAEHQVALMKAKMIQQTSMFE